MAGKYASSAVTITYDDAPGGTGRAITNFVMNLGGVKIVVDTVDSTAFGDAWREHLAAGMRSMPDIAVSGFFDTTATTGPHTVLRVGDSDADPQGGTRTLVVVFGDSKTFTVETLLVESETVAEVGTLQKFNALIRPTGTGTWS